MNLADIGVNLKVFQFGQSQKIATGSSTLHCLIIQIVEYCSCSHKDSGPWLHRIAPASCPLVYTCIPFQALPSTSCRRIALLSSCRVLASFLAACTWNPKLRCMCCAKESFLINCKGFNRHISCTKLTAKSHEDQLLCRLQCCMVCVTFDYFYVCSSEPHDGGKTFYCNTEMCVAAKRNQVEKTNLPLIHKAVNCSKCRTPQTYCMDPLDGWKLLI